MQNSRLSRFAKKVRLDNSGFTLVELLVVMAIIAILAALLLPGLSRTKAQAQGIDCLSNLRQCNIAWLTYNSDNKSTFAYNEEGDIPDPSPGTSPQGWIYGWEGYVGTDQWPDPPDANTNSIYCLSGGYAQIGPYLKNASALHCPTDLSANQPGGIGLPRIRSYSMNQAIGANHNGDSGVGGSQTDPLQGAYLPYPTFQVYFKESDVVRPSPSKLWILTDENADGINDGAFGFVMPQANMTQWDDVPAKRHNNCCPFTFLDGHVEMHRWLQPQNIPGELNGPRADNPQLVQLAGAGFGDGPNLGVEPDIYWLAWRTTYPMDTSIENVETLMNFPDPGL